MFQLDHISKAFQQTQALSDVSLDIDKGEMVALIGPSGSGKTTLLKLLNAQHMPTSGRLAVDGADIESLSRSSLKQVRQQIAYIPQDLGLVPNLKVFQNILLGKIGSTASWSLIRQFFFPTQAELTAIHSILEDVGIPEKLYQQTSSLSGGQQQRVAVARALYQNAHTILADEPVSAVDPARARSLVTLLSEISAEKNISVIMSIHNTDIATAMFPRIIGLKSGHLAFDTASPTEEAMADLYLIPDQQITEA